MLLEQALLLCSVAVVLDVILCCKLVSTALRMLLMVRYLLKGAIATFMSLSLDVSVIGA